MVDLDAVLAEVGDEVLRAEAKHQPMASAHEGLAVIWEEFLELRAEVFKGGSVQRDHIAMRKEAIETAAMAVRFIRDVCWVARESLELPDLGDDEVPF